jgi:hypothetical protein
MTKDAPGYRVAAAGVSASPQVSPGRLSAGHGSVPGGDDWDLGRGSSYRSSRRCRSISRLRASQDGRSPSRQVRLRSLTQFCRSRLQGSGTPNPISAVVIGNRASQEKQGEYWQEVRTTHRAVLIGVFTLINRRQVDQIPGPPRSSAASGK